MVDLKSETAATPRKSKYVLSMSSVKNWLLSDKRNQDTPRPRMQDSLLRSIRRRSLRVRKTKPLVVQEKRKSGK